MQKIIPLPSESGGEDDAPLRIMVSIASFSVTASLSGYFKRSRTTTDLAATI
jgi:hypothetical protein